MWLIAWAHAVLADQTSSALLIAALVAVCSLAGLWVTVWTNRTSTRRFVTQDYATWQDAEIEDLRRDLAECKAMGQQLREERDDYQRKYFESLQELVDIRRRGRRDAE